MSTNCRHLPDYLSLKQPGGLLLPLLLVGFDLVAVAQRPADVVQALEQGLLSEVVDVEVEGAPGRCGDGLGGEVYVQGIALAGFNFVEEFAHGGAVERDGQDAVVETVVVKDIGEAGRDEAAEAVVANGPGCVLAGGAAAEVVFGQQNGGSLVARLVEDEIRVELRSGVIYVAPVGKEVILKTTALRRLEEARGGNLVGIDVQAVKRGHQARQRRKSFHGTGCFPSYC